MLTLLAPLLAATIIVGGMLLTLALLFALFAILPATPAIRRKRKNREAK